MRDILIYMSTRWFRPEISKLPAYVSGKRSEREDIIKLSSNEVPFGTIPEVAKAVAEKIQGINRYPDMANADIVAALAERENWPEDGIVVSNGSTALLEKILQAVTTPGGDVVYPWRSFEAYPIAILAAGGNPVPVLLREDGTQDLDAMLAKVTPETRCVMLCSPNNPTGTALGHAQTERFVEAIPESVPIIIDEAYIHFANPENVQDGLAIARKHPNVIVARTFSKVYGLAGLRIGYVLTSAEMATGIRAIATPFGVNLLAQAAGVAALEQREAVERVAQEIVHLRDELRAQAQQLGFEVPHSEANFLWFAKDARGNKLDGERFEEVCREEGILVRKLGDDGVRVTVAEKEGGLRLLAALRRLSAN